MNTELQNPIVKWPFGKADVVSLTATGNQAVDIYNNLTIVDGASVIATGARTLNLAISKDVEPGARLCRENKDDCHGKPYSRRRYGW